MRFHTEVIKITVLHYTALARTSYSFSIDSLQRKIIRFGHPNRLHCAWRCVWYDTSTIPSSAHPSIHQTTHLHFHPYTHSARLTNQPSIHLSVCLSVRLSVHPANYVPTNQQTNQTALHLYNPVKKCAQKRLSGSCITSVIATAS
jgi:hypothetical protein